MNDEIDKSQETPINRGELFMHLRRSNREESKDVKTVSDKTEERPMTTTLVVLMTAFMIVGGSILGFIVGWFASAYYQSYIDIMVENTTEVDSPQVTPHPEMLDSEGNMIPYMVSKLISVEFDPVDSFDSDPFPDD